MSINELWQKDKQVEVFARKQGMFPVRTSFFYHFWSKGMSFLVCLSILFCLALTFVFSIVPWLSLTITIALAIAVMVRFKDEVRIVTFDRMKKSFESTNTTN
ncbi:hypothetical protein [Paenibacillus thiaminolyticus]|uniref:Uncharacterized protein n=1 Tax=Paenibacillus thiaminolyticus TaxID=49283 RepID=A0A3A3GUT2_PANTH|nr:hypothetical protein [Paenibacillus thiaminolyticus]RJG15625.1 hypothetical protein DQX05_29530 [Paenibacillus thiaminolyticus]